MSELKNTERPKGSNADEWAAFLSENCTHDTIEFVAVQIAEAIEEGAKQAQICCDSYAAENQRFHDEIERLKAEVESLHLQMEDILGQRT